MATQGTFSSWCLAEDNWIILIFWTASGPEDTSSLGLS